MPKFNYNAFITAKLPELREYLGKWIKSIEWDGKSFKIITQAKEGKVLDAIHTWHDSDDVDILGYNMTFDMQKDPEDDTSFIPGMTLEITRVEN